MTSLIDLLGSRFKTFSLHCCAWGGGLLVFLILHLNALLVLADKLLSTNFALGFARLRAAEFKLACIACSHGRIVELLDSHLFHYGRLLDFLEKSDEDQYRCLRDESAIFSLWFVITAAYEGFLGADWYQLRCIEHYLQRERLQRIVILNQEIVRTQAEASSV